MYIYIVRHGWFYLLFCHEHMCFHQCYCLGWFNMCTYDRRKRSFDDDKSIRSPLFTFLLILWYCYFVLFTLLSLSATPRLKINSEKIWPRKTKKHHKHQAMCDQSIKTPPLIESTRPTATYNNKPYDIYFWPCIWFAISVFRVALSVPIYIYICTHIL